MSSTPVWLFYDDSLKYSRIADDKYMTLDAWTEKEDLYDMRYDLFDPKGVIDCVKMNTSEFAQFCQHYSDKQIRLYSLAIDKLDSSADASFEYTKITIPLTYCEYADISSNGFVGYIERHSEMFLPSEIFKHKYVKALRTLGMEEFYSYTTDQETLELFNNSDFAVENNVLYDYYDISDSLHLAANEFSYFLLLYGNRLRKDFYKKCMKG